MREDTYSRQSFLGSSAQKIFSTANIGIIGLGGGGSHIAQQLAHLGLQNYALFDPQLIDVTNLNRLIGGKRNDVRHNRSKVCIAARTIKGIQPNSKVQTFKSSWTNEIDAFRTCDLLFACVDSYIARQQIETSARRYLIPVIDIGMDVFELDNGRFSMSGQVILSLPDYPCMNCMGFLNEAKLREEARRYGDAGPAPQVVWSNGVLASLAVGIGVELLTGWTKSQLPPLYLTYDGNRGTVQSRPILSLVSRPCVHFPAENVGDPVFRSP
jgi:molybdopterin/thiamine biosynthesis adenylyltransferase